MDRRTIKKRTQLFLSLLLVAACVAVVVLPAQAGQDAGSRSQAPFGNSWVAPKLVPGYDDMAFPPYMVVDGNGTVHAFNSVVMGDLLVIVYSQWTEQNGWTNPNDIFISPIKLQARVKGAFLDEAGYVHLIFWGGDDLGANIYYSKAHVTQVSNAQSWLKPMLVGDTAIAPSEAVLAGDGKGNLYILYSANRDGVGVFAVYSEDGGISWTDPSLVYLTADDVHWPVNFNLHRDGQGNLHFVWTIVGNQGNGELLYYARMDPSNRVWTDPIVVATRDPGDYEVDWGSVISYNDELFLVYQDSFPATRWFRRSNDGGNTWSDPVLPFDYVGEYGFVSMLVDSSNFLHMLLGNRTDSAIHGMWHSVWLGDRWSDLEPVVSGPRITTGPLHEHFDPNRPYAVMVRGNLIFVTWFTDPGAGRNGIWYSYARINTPELPASPIPTPMIEPTRTPFVMPQIAVPLADPTEEAFILETGKLPPPSSSLMNPAFLMLAGVLPSLLLILVVVVIFKIRVQSRD
jgi:hypothetical protein